MVLFLLCHSLFDFGFPDGFLFYAGQIRVREGAWVHKHLVVPWALRIGAFIVSFANFLSQDAVSSLEFHLLVYLWQSRVVLLDSWQRGGFLVFGFSALAGLLAFESNNLRQLFYKHLRLSHQVAIILKSKSGLHEVFSRVVRHRNFARGKRLLMAFDNEIFGFSHVVLKLHGVNRFTNKVLYLLQKVAQNKLVLEQQRSRLGFMEQ